MINLKKLGKALGTKPETVMWFKKDGFDYISDGRFMIKVASRRMASSVISNMVKFIGKVPEDGCGYRMMDKDNVIDFTQIDTFSDMVSKVPEIELERTDLIQSIEKINLRIFARKGNNYKSDKYVRVNEKYENIIDNPSKWNFNIVDGNTSGLIAWNESDEERVLILPVYVPNFTHKHLNMDKGE